MSCRDICLDIYYPNATYGLARPYDIDPTQDPPRPARPSHKHTHREIPTNKHKNMELPQFKVVSVALSLVIGQAGIGIALPWALCRLRSPSTAVYLM